METPGPFMGTREDVLEYIREFYEITRYIGKRGLFHEKN
jgi:hypothetical protein